MRAAVAGALNAALAGADRMTLKLEENRAEMGGSLAAMLKELDVDVLRRVMRRSARLAVTAARASGRGAGKGRAGRAAGGRWPRWPWRRAPC